MYNIEESQTSYPFYGLALMLIAIGVLMMAYIVYELSKQYKIQKNTAETIERYVAGTVKSKNSRTNIRTVSESEQVNLKNVSKLDKDGNILESTFWIV